MQLPSITLIKARSHQFYLVHRLLLYSDQVMNWSMYRQVSSLESPQGLPQGFPSTVTSSIEHRCLHFSQLVIAPILADMEDRVHA